MDQSVRQEGSSRLQPGRLLARLRIIGGIVNWLAGLIRMTEDDKVAAGIYLGD